MADSVQIALNPDTWTDVTGGVSAGFITNEGKSKVIYQEAAADPGAGDVTGHTLNIAGRVGNDIRFAGLSQSIWARSVVWDGVVEFTAV